MFADIRIKKIIMVTMWEIIFFEASALLDVRHFTKLQFCAISRKTSDATLRKW